MRKPVHQLGLAIAAGIIIGRLAYVDLSSSRTQARRPDVTLLAKEAEGNFSRAVHTNNSILGLVRKHRAKDRVVKQSTPLGKHIMAFFIY